MWCTKSNPKGCTVFINDPSASFKWDGKQQVVDNEFQRDGKTFKWHEVFSDITPTSFVQTADIGEKGGPLKRWLTIHATRMPEAVTRSASESSNPSSAPAEAVYSPVPEANGLFLEAREYFRKGNPALGGALSDVRKSIELFEAAIAKDPHFALAYAELSTAWAFLGWSAPDGLQNIDVLPHVRAAALKAVELDDRLPAAHLALASVYLNFEFDWPRAEGEYKRASELAPNDSRGHSAYAVYLSKMGRFSEALTQAQRASELSQTSATDRMFMFIYFAMRRFDLAEQYGLSASRKDDHFLNHMFLGFTYLQGHKYFEGISEFEKLRAGGTGGGLAGLAYAYAVGGRTADARLLLKQLTAIELGGPVIVPYRVAAVYLALGDKDKAIELLRKDYDAKDNWMNWLKVDPIMDPLRSDPRFADLMRLMKFESDKVEQGGELERVETIHTVKPVEASREATEISSAEADLRALMAERRKASLEGDPEKIASSMADGYLQTDISGHVQDKVTWLREYFNPIAELIRTGKFRWEIYDQKELQFRIYGESAVVVGVLEAKGRGARWVPQRHTWEADPNASFSGTLRFTHVYIKRNGKWLLAALHNAVPLMPSASN